MKYVIMCDSNNTQPFVKPRQLTIINGETLTGRTIRLLKENGVEDVIVTSHDKRFDNLGAKRYEPQNNNYDGKTNKGYWLDAFTWEFLNEPVTYLFGDVYYSENAIKTIVETDTDSTLFFCTYKNTDRRYIKHHDEPLAYKVRDTETFKKHINIVKKMYDDGLTVRRPISWELYRSINGQDVNKHVMTKNYVAINDESCDIDTLGDIILLENVLGGKEMVKCKVIERFTLNDFNKLVNVKRASGIDTKGLLAVNDEFECDEEMAKYLTTSNKLGRPFVKILEVIPAKEDKVEGKAEQPKPAKKVTKKKTSKKK